MKKQTFELVMNKRRYQHLKENLGDKVNFVGYHEMPNAEPEDTYIKFSIEIGGILDLLDVYHTGIKYGLGIGLGKIHE